jgi:hypothetical protein
MHVTGLLARSGDGGLELGTAPLDTAYNNWCQTNDRTCWPARRPVADWMLLSDGSPPPTEPTPVDEELVLLLLRLASSGWYGTNLFRRSIDMHAGAMDVNGSTVFPAFENVLHIVILCKV